MIEFASHKGLSKFYYIYKLNLVYLLKRHYFEYLLSWKYNHDILNRREISKILCINSIDGPETDAHIYSQLVYDKDAIKIQ